VTWGEERIHHRQPYLHSWHSFSLLVIAPAQYKGKPTTTTDGPYYSVTRRCQDAMHCQKCVFLWFQPTNPFSYWVINKCCIILTHRLTRDGRLEKSFLSILLMLWPLRSLCRRERIIISMNITSRNWWLQAKCVSSG
jgi:hypothetical protein